MTRLKNFMAYAVDAPCLVLHELEQPGVRRRRDQKAFPGLIRDGRFLYWYPDTHLGVCAAHTFGSAGPIPERKAVH